MKTTKHRYSLKLTRLLIVLIPILYASASFGQDSTARRYDSTEIKRAVYWVKKGQHDKAKTICKAILLRNPNDVKCKILLGRVYSWDKQFDSARVLLQDALKQQPQNEEALNAIINVELWSGQFDKSMECCQKALGMYPNSESLLMKKAKIFSRQLKYKEAAAVIDQVLRIYPMNFEAMQFRNYLMQKMAVRQEKNGVGLSYQYDHFNNTYTPWNYLSLYYYHKGSKLGISTGVNYANRYGQRGFQYEVNLYPKISSSISAIITAAYSNDSVFPTYNLGAGLTHRIFRRGDLELGARYLNFKSLPDPIFIYTGAFSYGFRRVWGSIRAYVTPLSTGVSKSYYFTARYYLNNPKNNITLVLNTGLSPHDYLDPITGKSYNYPTKSQRAKLTYQTVFFSQKNLLKISVGYETRDYYANVRRERITSGLAIERLF